MSFCYFEAIFNQSLNLKYIFKLHGFDCTWTYVGEKLKLTLKCVDVYDDFRQRVNHNFEVHTTSRTH